MTLFDDIIKQQINLKHKYKSEPTPETECICIIIKDNKILQIIHGKASIPWSSRERLYVSLINNVLEKYKVNDCNININLCDRPKVGYFNFCREKNNYSQFLLPNHRFSNSDIQLDENNITFKNFNEEKSYILSKHRVNKKNKIYTSCIPHRSKLAYLNYAINNKDICDGWAYTDSVHGKVHMSDNLYKVLKNNNMAGETKHPWIEHLNYKYVLYNDGNTLSDRMRLLLCTNSVILKDKKSNYEEFYSYLLKNNVNFIEYTDITELRSIYNTLESNPVLYDKIISNNNEFIHKYLDYDEILLYTYNIITSIACK